MSPFVLQCQRAKLPKVSQEALNRLAPTDPNDWFAQRFPESARRFGPPFIVQNYVDTDGLPRTRPIEVNIDFFASALEGDRRMGHHVIFYAPEETFYFRDPSCMNAFCSTSESKLEALLSNYLIRCAQDCGGFTDIEPLVTEFRKPKLLRSAIERAKALLAADQSFFQGANGYKRMIDGKLIEPCAPPVHEAFIQQVLVPEADAAITVTECYHTYFRFCRDQGAIPPSRKEFQAVVTEAIRAAFNVGLRHDVPARNGKQANGWKGIAFREQGAETSAGRN